MNERSAPRSIEQYLEALRAALAGEDPALVQDALYDAEEYLRAEVAANPDRSEADTLELIASTYGAPDEVAGAYRTTEKQVRTALAPPPRKVSRTAFGRFFAVYGDSQDLDCTLLHAAGAGDWHLLLHSHRRGTFLVRRPDGNDHRHPGVPAVRRIHARAGTCRRADWSKGCWASACRAGPCTPARERRSSSASRTC